METNPVTRRAFGSWLAAASACAAGAVSSTQAACGDESAAKKVATAAKDPPAKPNLPAERPSDGTPAEHALRILLARFPDERLDAAAQVSLLVDLERHQARSKVLASVELANGEEPGAPFRAIVHQG